jgi:two-component system LytT family sensor kinase
MTESHVHSDRHATRLLPRSPLFWLLIAVSWTIFGTLMALEIHGRYARNGLTIAWEDAFSSELLYAWCWGLLTPVIMLLAYRIPLNAGTWKRNLPVQMAAGILVTLAHKMIYGLAYFWHTVGLARAFGSAIAALLDHVDYGITLFWLLTIAIYSIEYYRASREHELRASELSAQLAQAQLGLLRMQLQPHFLFNTLNAISVLVESDPAGARTMVNRLADMLRMTLETGSAQKVPLRRELDLLEGYLRIEQARFPDRLDVSVDPAEETLDAPVPSLLLQPLVENAIRHGVARNRARTAVRISARRTGERLVVVVEDDGPGVRDPDAVKEGIGLSNTRSRLDRLYGGNGRLEISAGRSHGFTATITIPFEHGSNGSQAVV